METIRQCEIISPDNAERKTMPNATSGSKISSMIDNNSGLSVPNSNKQGDRATVHPAYLPPPDYRIQGTIMKNEAPACIIPIAALNSFKGQWAIKATVTVKGSPRSYRKSKVFSFDLLDSGGGEIRVICFNDDVDRFYETIEVGKVYVVSKGRLVHALGKNGLKNEWEIFLGPTSTVDLCPDEDASTQQFSFRLISEENVENDSTREEKQIENAENDSTREEKQIENAENDSTRDEEKRQAENKREEEEDEMAHLFSDLGKSFCKMAGTKWEEEDDEELKKGSELLKMGQGLGEGEAGGGGGEGEGGGGEENLCGICGLLEPGIDEISGLVENPIDWVQCDACDRWFHTKCVRMTMEKAKKLVIFKCSNCKGGRTLKKMLCP